MKKFLKKIVTMGLTLALAVTAGLGLMACGSSGKVKIGVGFYESSGPAVTATKAFLEGIKDELNVEFAYVTLSLTDEATNKTKAQELISLGCKGMILTMDSGTTSILEECKKAGVYLAGYLADYDQSYETIKNNEYFLGTICDGRYKGTAWGEEIADRVIAEGYKNIGMVRFPPFAYPHQIEMSAGFRAKIAAYNATVDNSQKITVQEEDTELMFAPLEVSYFDQNPNIDAIFGMCAGAQYIYNTMVTANKTNIKLYTAGLTKDDAILNNFGTKGTQTFQELVYSPSEAIIYPLVMLINKINGKTFSDNPSEAQRVESSQIRIQNDADVETVKQYSMSYTGSFAQSFLTIEQVKELLAENGGTHAKLVEAVHKMSIEDLRALHS